MVELPIRSVVVHRDGALVTRSGRTTPVSGRVVVSRLPLLLDAGSVRATVDRGAVQAARVTLDVALSDRGAAPDLDVAIEQGEVRLAALRATLDAIEREEEFVRTLRPPGPGRDRSAPDAARLQAWSRADDALVDWMRDLVRLRESTTRELEALLREHGDRLLRRDQASGEGWWRRWAPTRRVVVEVDDAHEIDVEVSYRVPGAFWTPAYAVRVDGSFQHGQIVARALVAQATGEDWTHAQLTLSTGSLVARTDAPKLRALRLGRAQPVTTGWRELPTDLDSLFPDDLTAPGSLVAADTGGFVVSAPMEVAESWEESSVALDTELPQPTRRGRLAEPTPPPAEARERVAMPKAAPPMAAAPFLAQAAAPRGGGGPPPPPPARPAPAAPAPPIASTNALDYASLRMVGHDGGPGVRGTLRVDALADEVARRGAPSDVVRSVEQTRRTAARQAQDLAARALPPQHSLPGPIGGVDFRYEAVAPVDVPADGRLHGVPLFTAPLTLEMRHRAVPQLDDRVFRTLNARFETNRPLLPGPVDVYVDGALEQTTHLPSVGGRTGGDGGLPPIQLGLGAEDRLKLVRNVRYREESKGLFGGERRVHTDEEIEIASSLPYDTQVELLLRVPVPEDDQIRVELTHAEPAATPFKGEPPDPVLRGGQRQALKVPAGRTATARLSHHMTMSAKNEIEGGERRG